MKKINNLLLTAMTIIISSSVVGCSNTNSSNTTPTDGKLTLMLDSSAFIYGFDDIDVAISEHERDMAAGTLKNNQANKSILENTKLLKAWGEEKGKTIVSKNWGWADSLTQKLMSAFLSQETPDLIQGETQMPGFAKQGYLEAFPDELANYVRENVSPIAYKDMEIDGKIYGISLTPSPSLLYWNKDILRQANVSSEIIENGPKTWSEWESVMAQIYATKDSKGVSLNAGGIYVGNGGVNYGAFFRVGTLMDAAGGSIDDSTGAPNLVTDANEKAFQFLINQKNYNQGNILNTKDEGSYFSYFNTNKIAYKVDGIWGAYEANLYGQDIGYCVLPSYDGTGSGGSMLLGATYSSVPIYAKNKELAFESIQFMLSKEIQDNIAKGGQRIPVLKETINTIYDQTDAEWYNDFYADYKEYASYCIEEEIHGLPDFTMKKGKLSNLWNAFGNSVAKTSIKSNNQSAKELLQEAQRAMITEWNKG